MGDPPHLRSPVAVPSTGGIAQWLLDGAAEALARMSKQAERVGLANTDEATFRSFFMAAVSDANSGARFETEWRRIDLLVGLGGRVTLVEFKYYVHRRNFDLDQQPRQWKGGAGVQNEREFWECVAKLRSLQTAPQDCEKYLVLVYQREASATRRKCFGTSYDSVGCTDGVTGIQTIERPPLVCKVLRI